MFYIDEISGVILYFYVETISFFVHEQLNMSLKNFLVCINLSDSNVGMVKFCNVEIYNFSN